MKAHRRVWVAIIAVAVAVPMVGHAAKPYYGGATVVVKKAGEDADLDRGITVCDEARGIGIGGGCLPFPNDPRIPNFIGVDDALAGDAVAFQVCIDMNGDFKCVSGPDHRGLCDDRVWFSHDDKNDFFNPLGPLPPSIDDPFFLQLLAQCNPHHTGWIGYVVFLCDSVHATASPHQHLTTTGTIRQTVSSPDAGKFGDFCGGIKGDVIKEYEVIQ